MGLVGCVMSLRIDSKEAEKEFNLMFPGSDDVIGGTGIGMCQNSSDQISLIRRL